MKTKGHILILTGFIAIVIIYHIIGYIGHYGYDDLRYAKLAYDFKNGILDYNDHFLFRTPVIVLTSLSYLIFGLSDFASSLPALLMSVLTLIIVFKSLREKGSKTLIIGLALTTFSNWFIFYSDKLMPDMYVALSVICTLYIIHQYKFRNKSNRIILFSLLLILSLLFGFMSKGTIVLILPLLIYYFIADIIQKQNIRFWAYTIIGGILIFSLYFIVIWLLTGDFFKRFDAIISNSYLNLCSYDKQSFIVLIKRVVYGFFELIIYQGMATGFIFIMAHLADKKSFRFLRMTDSLSFWITSSIILLLSSNFMSISLTSYSPMCLDPRHYLFLIPVVSIPAAIIIADFIENKALKLPIITLIAAITIISFFQGNIFWQLYFPLFLLFSTFIFIKNNQLHQKIFIGLFIAIFLVSPFNSVNYAHKIDYRKQKEIFTEHILKSNDSSLVITNEVQKRLGDYYSKFSDANNFLNYKEFRYDSTDNRKKILFLNWYTRYLSGMDFHDLPYYAKNISPNNTLLFQDKKLNISIYEMKDFSIPDQTGIMLFHSINSFEKKAENWKQNDKDISGEVKYEGNYSIRVNEYSSTFEFFLDSLDFRNTSQLLIRCSAFCNYNDHTKSKLVISVENEEGVYIWNSMDIDKYIKAYSNWWPISHEINVNESDIKENSKLNIYLWNVDKKKAYLDNFQVEIIGY
jgi:hypothetical protein